MLELDNNYEELYHHGVIGQKWGVRRYQNEDGTLTEEGKAHYGNDSGEGPSDYDRKRKTMAAIGGAAALGVGIASGAYLANKMRSNQYQQPIVVEPPPKPAKTKEDKKSEKDKRIKGASSNIESVTDLLSKINKLGKEADSIETNVKQSSIVNDLIGILDGKNGKDVKDAHGAKQGSKSESGKSQSTDEPKKSLTDRIKELSNGVKEMDTLGKNVNSLESTVKNSSLASKAEKLFGGDKDKDKGKPEGGEKSGNPIKSVTDKMKSVTEGIKEADALTKQVNSLEDSLLKSRFIDSIKQSVQDNGGLAIDNLRKEIARGETVVKDEDSVIKKGSILKSLSPFETARPEHMMAMWVTDNDNDEDYYKGIYSIQMKTGGAPKVYQHRHKSRW